MSKKKRKPLPRVGGKATSIGGFDVTPEPFDMRKTKNAIAYANDTPGMMASKARVDPLLSAIKASEVNPNVTGWVASGGLADIATGETDFTLSGEDVLRHARPAIPMHDADPHDPRLPNRLSPEQVDRIIYEHPTVAAEGLAKLGRILQVPMTTEADSGVHIPPFEPLELKAKVVNDLAVGRYHNMVAKKPARQTYTDMTADILDEAVVIDIQAVYDRWMAGATGNDLYDLRMAPPWMNAVMLYNNSHGNVWCMHLVASDLHQENWSEQTRQEIQWQPMEPADHKIHWDEVRWVYSVQVYVGGLGRVKDGVHVPTLGMQQTTGPLMVWRIAVYSDGVPADIHWTHVAQDVPFHKFNNAMGAMAETINMCNCVNVHVAESERSLPRAQRRRLARYGVRFSEVHIRPTSKSYKGKGTPLADMTTPIHGVIGHYATYGQDGRGLLFGKHAGRYWIPPHVRGSKEAGEIHQKYVAEA